MKREQAIGRGVDIEGIIFTIFSSLRGLGMASKYTNVENVKHGITALSGVKSVTLNDTRDFLFSQADGNRQQQIVGELGKIITITLEFEDEAAARSAEMGVAQVDDVTFDVQLDSDPGIVKIWTVTNVIFNVWDYSSDQAGLNAQTLNGRCQSEADTATVA